MQLPKDVQYLLHCLTKAGFSAYVVGGCVRDFLMGRTPMDWDICTNASPEQTKKVFCFHKLIEAGIVHGTVVVLLNGLSYEITTFRCDGVYLDYRRPQSVTFTNEVAQDMQRRDFTINAMAYNETEGLVDVVGGAQDINKQLLRTVGNPATRFGEDALRIMRCLRFCATLNFRIEPETSACILKEAPLLANIAVERICSEFSKLLCGENCRHVLGTYRLVLEVFLPALHDVNAREYEWKIALLARAPSMLCARLGVLFSLFPAEERISLLQKMKYSNAIIQDTIKYCDYAVPVPTQRKEMKLLLAAVGMDAVKKRLLIQSIAGVPVQSQQEQLNSILEEGDCISMQQLSINGHQLIAMGYRGKTVGKLLCALLNKVITTNAPNEYETLRGLVPLCMEEIEQEKSNA